MGLTPSSSAARHQAPVIQVLRKEFLIILILPRKIKKNFSVLHLRASASDLASRSLNQNLTYVFPVRTFESKLSCRSLNQNLPPVLDVDALLRGQRGEAAAGEVMP